jgi:hypothetical protein
MVAASLGFASDQPKLWTSGPVSSVTPQMAGHHIEEDISGISFPEINMNESSYGMNV